MGAQEPPARRSARLVAVAAQRAGPSYALPGQAASTVSRGTQKQDWVRIKSAYQPKVGQNSTGVDIFGNLAVFLNRAHDSDALPGTVNAVGGAPRGREA